MDNQEISRRSFIGKTAMTAGLTALGVDSMLGKASGINNNQQDRLPREVWIATVSQQALNADTPERMVQTILGIIDTSLVYRPDIICLPEIFMTCNVRQTKSLQEETERSAELLKGFMAFAEANRCYVICPVYASEKGRIYNSAVVIDRQGNRVGEYKKIHLPESEIALGITPGPLQPPVFKTDFGTIGIQICFDNIWDDGWKALQQQGAEIVFWPSAYAGGQSINTKAWQNRYVVVSSTNKGTAKICDISGDVVAKTGFWDNNLICAMVNLEKEFLFTWPNVRRFDDIRAKYGRKINITTYHEEEWTIIESLSPDVRVKDVLTEFKIRSATQMIHEGELANNRLRL